MKKRVAGRNPTVLGPCTVKRSKREGEEHGISFHDKILDI